MAHPRRSLCLPVLCSARPLRSQLGSLTYLRYSLVLVLGSNALMVMAQYLQRRYRGDPQISPYTVGYSGSVRLCGLSAEAALLLSSAQSRGFFILH